MARVTHVGKARQRYAQTPVLDGDGNPVRTPVTDKAGVQKVTKTGRPIFQSPTRNDTTRPLAMPVCDSCRKTIEVGSPYKHISPKSGPYGGRTLTRHESCPTWNVWEYSSSLSARVAQISHDAFAQFDTTTVETTDDVESILRDAAEEIRSLAEEKRDAAQNIEDGFGHETQMSQELNETADSLDGWADDVEGTDVPALPDPEEEDCDQCSGTGKVTKDCSYCSGTGNVRDAADAADEECSGCHGEGEVEEDCEDCEGSGQITPDDPSDEQMDEWRDEARDALSVLDDCPV